MKISISKLKGTRLHLVDVSGVARSRWHSFKEFSWEVDGKDVGTGAIYAVLSLLKDIPLEDKIIFCFDLGGNNRKEDYDGYKATRTFKDTEYFLQINKLREILLSCRYEILGQTDYEADDFIAGAVAAYYDKFDNIIIHANDKDLTQLIDEKGKVIFKSVITKQSDITRENYEKELKIPYNTIVLYKSTVGDTSDNIKGIPQFGPKKFEKLIEALKQEGKYDFTKIRTHEQEREIIMNYQGFTSADRAYALNSLSVVIPRLPNKYHFEDLYQNPVDIRALLKHLQRYGMYSITKKINEKLK